MSAEPAPVDEPPMRCVLRRSRHIEVVPLHPEHLQVIHEGLTASPAARHWRSRGRYVPSHLLEEFLTAEGRECLVVVAGERVIGLVEIFDLSALDRHAQVGAVSWAPGIASAFVVEGLILAMDHWFCTLPLDQLFLQTAATSAAPYRKALDSYLRQCGTLPAYLRIDGAPEDVVIFSMSRDQFVKLSSTTSYFRQLDVRTARAGGVMVA